MNKIIDGNSTSNTSLASGGIAILDIYYAIPDHAQINGSYWEVADGDGRRNLSFSGYNQSGSTLYVSVYSVSSPQVAPFWVYLTNGFHGVGAQYHNTTSVNPQIAEEGVWWNTTNFASGSLTNVSTKTVRKGDVWVMSCRATDTNGSVSAWVNSTGLTVGNTAPVNLWNLHNQTIGHNASIIFGGYCSDEDAVDTLVYSTNNTVFPILSNGSINWTANVSRSGNYSVNVSCSDNTANTTVRFWLNVSNTAPNATGVNLTPLPAQAGLSLNITYACSDVDNDVCNSSVFFAWFKNGVLNASITGRTLGAGNFTTGDNITGSVRVFDGNLNSSWRNTSVATVGDTTPPVLTGFSLSPTSTTTSGTVLIGANCTDNNAVGAVVAEVTDALSVRANFTMANTAGALYELSYPPPIAGTYSARVFCTDGNGNVANTSGTVFTVTASAGAGGGGGGGGSTITIVQGDRCDFSIVRPTNGFVNTLCPTGGRSANFSFVLQNEESTTQTYTTAFHNVDCQIDQATFSVPGNGQHESIIGNCACPTNVSIEGSINITSDVCTGELPIKLYNGVFSRLLFDQDTLIKAILVVFAIFIIAAAIIFLSR